MLLLCFQKQTVPGCPTVCWVFHLTIQKEGETREAEIYRIFLKSFFFPFLLCVFYSLRPGHAIVQNLLFEADAEKTKFRNIWKKHEQNESEKQSQALPFCFLLSR